MEQQLFGVTKLKVIVAIKGEKDGRFEVACFVFEMLHVSCEHIGEVLHYHGDVLEGLMLGFGVHH